MYENVIEGSEATKQTRSRFLRFARNKLPEFILSMSKESLAMTKRELSDSLLTIYSIPDRQNLGTVEEKEQNF